MHRAILHIKQAIITMKAMIAMNMPNTGLLSPLLVPPPPPAIVNKELNFLFEVYVCSKSLQYGNTQYGCVCKIKDVCNLISIDMCEVGWTAGQLDTFVWLSNFCDIV